MNYDHPELRDRLAADYVIGTLRGGARRRLERLIALDPAMAETVEHWQVWLNALVEAVPAIEPPPQVWAAIERKLPRVPTTSTANVVRFSELSVTRLWQTVAFWRGASIAAMALAASLAIYVAVRPVDQASNRSAVAVLSDASGHAAYVAITEHQGQAIALTNLSSNAAQPGHAYQLWLLPKNEKPRSLGLVAPIRQVSFALSTGDVAMLATADSIAISLEQAGGSPTGQPTGPILFKGALVTRQ